MTLQREEKTRAHLVSTTKVLLCASATCDNSVVCTYIPLGGTSNLPFESWCNFSHSPNAGRNAHRLAQFLVSLFFFFFCCCRWCAVERCHLIFLSEHEGWRCKLAHWAALKSCGVQLFSAPPKHTPGALVIWLVLCIWHPFRPTVICYHVLRSAHCNGFVMERYQSRPTFTLAIA